MEGDLLLPPRQQERLFQRWRIGSINLEEGFNCRRRGMEELQLQQ